MSALRFKTNYPFQMQRNIVKTSEWQISPTSSDHIYIIFPVNWNCRIRRSKKDTSQQIPLLILKSLCYPLGTAEKLVAHALKIPRSTFISSRGEVYHLFLKHSAARVICCPWDCCKCIFKSNFWNKSTVNISLIARPCPRQLPKRDGDNSGEDCVSN